MLSNTKILVEQALDLGVNFYVTTAHYSNGEIEEKVGLLSGIREKVVISTSGGISHQNGKIIIDSSRQALEKSIQKSLIRLQTDYLDHFEIHIYDPLTSLKETSDFLREYMESDIIRSVGTSSFQPEILRKLEENIPLSLVQCPLNPMQQRAYNQVFSTCKDLQIGLVTYSPFFMGLFWNSSESLELVDGRIKAPDIWKRCLLDLNKALKEQSQDTQTSISQLILNWIFWHGDMKSVLIGTNNIQHLEENVTAIDNPTQLAIIEETDKLVKSIFARLQPEIAPRFEVKVNSITQNSYGNYVIISDFGLKLPVSQYYPAVHHPEQNYFLILKQLIF